MMEYILIVWVALGVPVAQEFKTKTSCEAALAQWTGQNNWATNGAYRGLCTPK